MLHRYGFVRSIRPHSSSLLAATGWFQLILVYRPGGLDANFDEMAPDIGAPILMRDVGRVRLVCHHLSIFQEPLVLSAERSNDHEEHIDHVMMQSLPVLIP